MNELDKYNVVIRTTIKALLREIIRICVNCKVSQQDVVMEFQNMYRIEIERIQEENSCNHGKVNTGECSGD